MDADEEFWMLSGQGLGDDGPMVTASRDKLPVAQYLCHQSGKEIGVGFIAKGHAIGKTCPRDGRHNHVKRGLRVATIFCRISEPINYFVVAIERIGKPVEQEQWGRVGSFAAFVNEMDAYSIDLRFELSKSIERSFVLAPVIAMQPVIGDLLHIRQTDSICPARSLGLIRPEGSGQAVVQVVKGGLGN